MTTLTAVNSGNSIHDGPGSDSITVAGSGNVLTLGNATTDSVNLGNATGNYIFFFTPTGGSVLTASASVNATATTVLDGTTTAVHGSGLNFGTASAASPIFVNIGSVGGNTAAEVVTAANRAYVVADSNGNASTGALGEHVMFVGTDSGGNAEIWSFRAPLSPVTAGGHTVQVPVNGADLNGNHQVDINEISLVATLIGVPAASLTAANLA